jgi:hypothetical protein
MASSITASVGSYQSGGVNRKQDVQTIQTLLNTAASQLSQPEFNAGKVDGLIHRIASRSQTVRAIRAFQTKQVQLRKPDDRVDVGGLTWRTLIGVTGALPPRAPVAIAKSNDFAKSLAAIALKEVGIMEAASNNTGDDILKYKQATWLAPGAWPWCAAFVCWCYREALQKTNAQGISRPRTAAAWDFERWAREQRKVDLHKPAQSVSTGDIVVFTFSHIGIAVANESNGRVKTVEGNTNVRGTRDGGGRTRDGVYEKLRQKSQIRSVIRTMFG